MKKQNQPIKVKVTDGDEAWAYIDTNGIEIYIRENKKTVSAKIYEKQIVKYLSDK
jgi:hypothetical protein